MEQNNYPNENDYINIKFLISCILRSKFTIIFSVFLASIISIIYSYKVKPIWIGNFEILVKQKSTGEFLNSSTISLKDIVNKPTNNVNQEFILKSPSVLMPIYKYEKETYKRKNNKNYNLSFKNWIITKLNIEFKQDSNVLLVEYKDTDKKYIIDILTRISNRYKDYSSDNQQKNLIQT